MPSFLIRFYINRWVHTCEVSCLKECLLKGAAGWWFSSFPGSFAESKIQGNYIELDRDWKESSVTLLAFLFYKCYFLPYIAIINIRKKNNQFFMGRNRMRSDTTKLMSIDFFLLHFIHTRNIFYSAFYSCKLSAYDWITCRRFMKNFHCFFLAFITHKKIYVLTHLEALLLLIHHHCNYSCMHITLYIMVCTLWSVLAIFFWLFYYSYDCNLYIWIYNFFPEIVDFS